MTRYGCRFVCAWEPPVAPEGAVAVIDAPIAVSGAAEEYGSVTPVASIAGTALTGERVLALAAVQAIAPLTVLASTTCVCAGIWLAESVMFSLPPASPMTCEFPWWIGMRPRRS